VAVIAGTPARVFHDVIFMEATIEQAVVATGRSSLPDDLEEFPFL
jgi:hypothetical protein